MPEPQQQTFTDVQPVQQSFTDVTPIDAPKKPGFMERLGQSLGIPTSKEEVEQSVKLDWSPSGVAKMIFGPPAQAAEGVYDYGKRAIQNAGERNKEILDAARNIKEGGPIGANLGKAAYAALHSEVSSVPFIGEPVNTAGQDVANKNYSGAAGGLTGAVGQVVAPEILEGAGKIMKGISPTARVEHALGRQLTPQEAALPIGNSTTQPALGVTPQETLNYISKKGGKLTPGQATEDPFAQKFEALGESAAMGGKDLALAKRQERIKFGDAVNNTIESADPKRLGLSDESAGEHIQHSAKVAMGTRMDNATQAYKTVSADQANLAGDVSPLTDYANSKLNVRQPAAAVTRPEYQSPQVSAALQDIAGKEDALGAHPSIQSMRNLRTELWEKGNDFSGNIPDSARAHYKTAAGIVDDQIMKAAQGTPFEKSFRDASSQWKDLQQKFNEPGTIFYKVLQQKDPAKITSLLQNSPATDIEALKSEGMTEALEPLKRVVLKEIANNKFGVGQNGLGGYSHSYLNTLFGPDATKELYLQADWARRLKFQGNPSGTAGTMAAEGQIGTHLSNWEKLAKLTSAAKMSMPRDPVSFLPAKPAVRSTPFSAQAPAAVTAPVSISSPLTGGALTSPEKLFRTSAVAAPEQSDYAFRVRDVGEKGVPATGSHAHATTSLDEAQSYVPGRESVQGKAQQITKYDLSKLKEGIDYERIKRPGKPDWIRHLRPLPESAIRVVGGG